MVVLQNVFNIELPKVCKDLSQVRLENLKVYGAYIARGVASRYGPTVVYECVQPAVHCGFRIPH